MFHDVSWASYRDRADAAAAGLLELGVQHGDRVAILSENRVEWPIADHAILSAGAADVPLHAPLAARQVEYQVGHSQSRGIVVSGQEQADKIFAVLTELPNLEFLISFDPIKAPKTSLEVLSWDGLIQRGRQSKRFADVRRVEEQVTGDDLATIIYTSGTTGNPKGVMLTHANLLSNVEATLSLSEQQSSDILLSWLPYSHIYARTIDLYVTAQSGATLALAESMDTLVINLAEIQPTWMTAVPRFYEKVWTRVEHLPPDQQKEKLWKIFGPRLKHLSSGGAPLPKHICKAFTEVGLPLLEGYGLTETSPVISFNSLDSNRIGTVGKPIPGVEVKIAPDGEILTRGPHVMKGYWRNPEATAEAIRDGWFHTGDVGSIDADGYLSITDRKKDLFIT
ncbi:MAG: long-chain fatty acid--CoA ligase, partial [Planctomycetaceae bacterium]